MVQRRRFARAARIVTKREPHSTRLASYLVSIASLPSQPCPYRRTAPYTCTSPSRVDPAPVKELLDVLAFAKSIYYILATPRGPSPVTKHFGHRCTGHRYMQAYRDATGQQDKRMRVHAHRYAPFTPCSGGKRLAADLPSACLNDIRSNNALAPGQADLPHSHMAGWSHVARQKLNAGRSRRSAASDACSLASIALLALPTYLVTVD